MNGPPVWKKLFTVSTIAELEWGPAVVTSFKTSYASGLINMEVLSAARRPLADRKPGRERRDYGESANRVSTNARAGFAEIVWVLRRMRRQPERAPRPSSADSGTPCS